MSNITGLHVNNLRIAVEPVDVELDEDCGILWTSLQTAFPGCSGMYYRELNGDTCKKSVRFDGKKFLAPGGAWNDREYFVTLSQRCHAGGMSSNSNSASYNEATKNFERSVQAVQKMMAASGMKIDMSQLTKKRHHTSSRDTVSSTNTNSAPSPHPPVPDPIQAIKDRSDSLLNVSDRDLTPLEQQFLDLARISTAKDQIIDANRQEISKLNQQIRKSEENIKKLEQKLEEKTAHIDGQEQQLEILRNFGKQFGETKRNAEELTKRSSDLEENMTTLQLKLMNAEELNESLKGQLETSENRIKEMSENIQLLTSSKEVLSKELNQLRPFADAAGIEDYENIPNYIHAIQENKKLHEENENISKAFDEIQKVQAPVFEENAKLRHKNEDLERRFEHVDEELKCLNENWAKELRDKQLDWTKIKNEAELEVQSLHEQLSHLQHILEAATREAAENARRVHELELERNDVRRLSDAVHIKSQEDLRRQVRILKEDLGEAQGRVAELNVLVATLASEANSSRRDISDLL